MFGALRAVCIVMLIASFVEAQEPPVGGAGAAAGCMAGRIDGDSYVFELPEGRATFHTTFGNGKLLQAVLMFETQGAVFGEREVQTRTVVAAPGGALGSVGLIRVHLDGQTGVLDPSYQAGLGIAFTSSGGWAAGVVSRGLNCQYRFDDLGAQVYGAFPTSIAYLSDRDHESQLLIADEGILAVARTTRQLRTDLEAARLQIVQQQGELERLRADLATAGRDLAILRAEIARLTGRLATLSSKRVFSVSQISKRIGRTLFKLSLRLPSAERSKARRTYRRLQKVIRLADEQNLTTATGRGDEIVAATRRTVVAAE